MSKKLFYSVEEAQELLISLKPMIQKMVELKKELNRMGFDVYKHEYYGGMGPNGTGKFPKEMDELIDIVKYFSSINVEIKSLDTGLIDFPHVRKNGEQVYLCFIHGEEQIMFWHGLYSGFAGRLPLNEI
ncbi:MAG: DUF2203 domain-containing protein [Candidatus Kapaibacterium sp.]